MRSAIGISIVLAFFGADGALAAKAEQKKTAVAIKIAAAGKNAADVGVQAKAVATPASQAALAGPGAAKSRPTAPSLVARIDLRQQRMRVTVNGKLVANWSISSGKSGHETPAGQFRPQWSSKMHYSRKYNNSPMPYSVFFNRGIAMHGTSYTSRLGAPASHGCIRLRTANARKFYKLVHRHGYKRTRIVVTGRARMTRRTSRRATSRRQYGATNTPVRRNAYTTSRSGSQRHSLSRYDRRRAALHKRRVRQYYQTRRLVYPGDRR